DRGESRIQPGWTPRLGAPRDRVSSEHAPQERLRVSGELPRALLVHEELRVLDREELRAPGELPEHRARLGEREEGIVGAPDEPRRRVDAAVDLRKSLHRAPVDRSDEPKLAASPLLGDEERLDEELVELAV